MEPRPSPRIAEDADAAELERSAEGARPIVGYRVAGDLEVRSKHLEQELIDKKRHIRALEREVFALRRRARGRRALSAAAKGGLGAVAGTLAAMIAYGFGLVETPKALFTFILVSFGFTALLAMRWDPPDDGFPDAPPPRMPGP